jgi:hypothetical protein
MPPRFATILARLRQDLADCLSPDAIRDACHAAGHAWRRGVLDPVATVSLVLLQVLHGNTACQHVVHFGRWAFTASAFCQARKRLPLGVWEHLLGRVAEAARRATAAEARWRGHRVWIADGSSFSMPDTTELRDHFGQPGCQRPRCGFPVARLLVLVDMATGLLARAIAAPLRSHDMTHIEAVHRELDRDDVLLADRAFCSFAHLAALARRGLHAVVRVHQKQIVDFTAGRAHVPPEAKKSPQFVGLPRSRWLRALGTSDQAVAWSKAAVAKPRWMGAEDFAALPAELVVRELRYRVEAPGFRTRCVTLVTTLVDAAAYPAEALAELYFRRWRVETALDHLKTTMKMDVLKCKTVDGIAKELAAFALAYDLVCSVMSEAAEARGVDPVRVSFVDALRWLIDAESGRDAKAVWINPRRPGRYEPRVVKRRPKEYDRMTQPRDVLRKRLLEQGDAA